MTQSKDRIHVSSTLKRIPLGVSSSSESPGSSFGGSRDVPRGTWWYPVPPHLAAALQRGHGSGRSVLGISRAPRGLRVMKYTAQPLWLLQSKHLLLQVGRNRIAV